MREDDTYKEELEYLLDYAEMTMLHFIPVWDEACIVAEKSRTEADARDTALELIGDMIDHGVVVGDRSGGRIPWDLPREGILRRIAAEMASYEDPLDFVYICWFILPDPE
ncbi:hypothetical protein ACFP1Z_00030 [Streptomyces gamaensis]|uniref:Uncharacterized protein n=1 Tax=Streptomyces gamaensis TaxID=1763542 RepID=A0ABW0YV57_9ACTN